MLPNLEQVAMLHFLLYYNLSYRRCLFIYSFCSAWKHDHNNTSEQGGI